MKRTNYTLTSSIAEIIEREAKKHPNQVCYNYYYDTLINAMCCIKYVYATYGQVKKHFMLNEAYSKPIINDKGETVGEKVLYPIYAIQYKSFVDANKTSRDYRVYVGYIGYVDEFSVTLRQPKQWEKAQKMLIADRLHQINWQQHIINEIKDSVCFKEYEV